MLGPEAAVDVAKESDAAFLAKACVLAERAHTTAGLWDVLFDVSEEDRLRILAHWIQHDAGGPLHFSRFVVVRKDERPVACCAGYLGDETSIFTRRAELQSAAEKVVGWTPEVFAEKWSGLQFFGESFPEDVDYKGAFMIEGVYTEPETRGMGLASVLVRAQVDKGRKTPAKQALITCSIGNDKAQRIYERVGFKLKGEGQNDECLKRLGYPGFRVLGFEGFLGS